VIEAVTTVRDVMAPAPLAVVDASISIDEAGRVMRAWDVDEVLVTDRGRLCGRLTGREVVVRSIASDRHRRPFRRVSAASGTRMWSPPTSRSTMRPSSCDATACSASL